MQRRRSCPLGQPVKRAAWLLGVVNGPSNSRSCILSCFSLGQHRAFPLDRACSAHRKYRVVRLRRSCHASLLIYGDEGEPRACHRAKAVTRAHRNNLAALRLFLGLLTGRWWLRTVAPPRGGRLDPSISGLVGKARFVWTFLWRFGSAAGRSNA